MARLPPPTSTAHAKDGTFVARWELLLQEGAKTILSGSRKNQSRADSASGEDRHNSFFTDMDFICLSRYLPSNHHSIVLPHQTMYSSAIDQLRIMSSTVEAVVRCYILQVKDVLERY